MALSPRVACLAGLLLAGCQAKPAPGPDDGTVSVVIADDGAIEVVGVSGSTSGLSVYTHDRETPERGARPAVLGRVVSADNRLRFLPRYPLVPGQGYRVQWRGPNQTTEAIVSVPASTQPATTSVTVVYPRAEVVPENLLKFYVEFSAPISRGLASDRIRLLGPNGQEVEGVLVLGNVELWNADATRLTLLFEPGRIKRGVLARQAMGPPLAKGGRYTLVIDRELKDARGAPLVSDYRHTFTVGTADDRQPRLADWTVAAPTTPTGSLRVALSEPLDYALLQRFVWVEDAQGARLAGHVTVGADSPTWAFQPQRAWRAGTYSLVVDRDLEDLAGNTLRRLFDARLEGDAPDSPSHNATTERRDFQVSFGLATKTN